MKASCRLYPGHVLCALLFLLPAVSCLGTGETAPTPTASASISIAPGPVSTPVQVEAYEKILYVSANTGSDSAGDGSQRGPWKSIHYALSVISDSAAQNRYAILVAQGRYSDGTIQMKEFIDLYGGFSPESWERDIFRYASILDGQHQGRVLTGADNARLDGFVVRGGRVRGQGGGILCRNVSPLLSNNRFSENRTLGPSDWNPQFLHETANDGGAVYCSDGASPKIENNVFARNSTEVGRGAAVAMDGECGGLIRGNFFYRNTSGLNDPMRSSDGGAISIFNASNPTVSNNVILGNRAESKNDGGGVFVALWSSATIKGNIFVDNRAGDDAGALFVGGQEHRYDRPLDPLPPEDRFFVSIRDNVFVGNGNPSRNSGAMRFTMEARGDFSSNVVVNNEGIYFQRSEVTIRNNTILDDFLFTETKAGLKKGRIFNNLIWGRLRILTEASVTFCNTREPFEGEGNINVPPLFEPDGVELTVDVVSFDPDRQITRITLFGEKLKAGSLAGRIIWANRHWGVVKSNDEMSIVAWGDLSGEKRFSLWSSYHHRTDSPCVDTGTNEDVLSTDFEGDPRPYDGLADIGADEFVPRP